MKNRRTFLKTAALSVLGVPAAAAAAKHTPTSWHSTFSDDLRRDIQNDVDGNYIDRAREMEKAAYWHAAALPAPGVILAAVSGAPTVACRAQQHGPDLCTLFSDWGEVTSGTLMSPDCRHVSERHILLLNEDTGRYYIDAVYRSDVGSVVCLRVGDAPRKHPQSHLPDFHKLGFWHITSNQVQELMTPKPNGDALPIFQLKPQKP